MNGYKNGVITEERLQDALERILGLKATLWFTQSTKRRHIITHEEKI